MGALALNESLQSFSDQSGLFLHAGESLSLGYELVIKSECGAHAVLLGTIYVIC
jgi:hypothetical protein